MLLLIVTSRAAIYASVSFFALEIIISISFFKSEIDFLVSFFIDPSYYSIVYNLLSYVTLSEEAMRIFYSKAFIIANNPSLLIF
jgi:hypothetical protein